MRLSAQVTMVIGVIFAVVCFSVAAKGFISLGELTDAKTISDAKGFAWFWAFLGAVALLFAGVSWWMVKTEKGDRG